jgi:hypothetical protein
MQNGENPYETIPPMVNSAIEWGSLVLNPGAPQTMTRDDTAIQLRAGSRGVSPDESRIFSEDEMLILDA